MSSTSTSSAACEIKDQSPLTLFIDRVDNYLSPDGVIRRLFVEEFNRLKSKYKEWEDVDPEAVQGAISHGTRTKST